MTPKGVTDIALLMRPDPFPTDVARLLTTVFGSTEGADGGPPRQRFVPAMDLTEEDEHFVVHADLPGLTEEDVAIEIEDNVLTISGEREREIEGERRPERGVIRYERSYGRFSRQLTLPEGTDAEGVAASFDKGVLEVRIPKPEERKPRRVSISVGEGRPREVEGTASPAS